MVTVILVLTKTVAVGDGIKVVNVGSGTVGSIINAVIAVTVHTLNTNVIKRRTIKIKTAVGKKKQSCAKIRWF